MWFNDFLSLLLVLLTFYVLLVGLGIIYDTGYARLNILIGLHFILHFILILSFTTTNILCSWKPLVAKRLRYL